MASNKPTLVLDIDYTLVGSMLLHHEDPRVEFITRFIANHENLGKNIISFRSNT